MDGQGTLPPNLADILSTLSRFAPANAANSSLPDALHAQKDQYSPSTIDSGSHPKLQDAHTRDHGQRQPISRPRDELIDPATITEWSSGLRCVSKMSSQNPDFANSIKGMINNQRRNEMDWYAKRQELKKLQAQRGSGKNELSSIMQAIGASTDPNAHKEQSAAEIQAELDQFDLKIHRAQGKMTEAMVVDLKALGVPFFGTSADRLIPEGQSIDQGTEKGPKWSPRITHSELRTLQQRMISYLEDMYKD